MPAFSAIGAYVAGTVFGLVGTAAVVVGTLVAVGAAYITSRIINGNPNKGNNSAQGSQGGRIQVPPATNNKIPVVYGNAYINGIITDARLITTDQKINDTMYYCIVLSETCNDPSAAYSLDNVYWNDLRLTAVDSTTNAHKIKDGRKNVDNPDTSIEDFIDTNFITDNKHLVQLRVYAGGSTSADQIYPAQASGNTQNAYDFWADDDGSWDSTYEMKGLVYAIVRVTYNGEKGFTGLPNLTFQINNNISNPADVWYDYMTSQRYGAGIDPSYIDTTAQTTWADFCDEDIVYTDKNGDSGKYTTRYSINGPLDTSRSVKENIDIIMQNAGAWLSYNVSTGLWSPIIKKAVTAGEVGLPATYFTASRSGSTLTVTNFPSGRIEAGQKLYNSAGTLIGTITAQLTPSLNETAGQLGRYTTSTSGSISSTTFYTLPATMLAFNDDNIISGITISSTRLDDLYNSYEAEFFDKYNKDQRAYARATIDAGERNPNEPDNQLRLSLDLCNNSVQADLLGQLELRQSRDDLVIEFTTNHYGIQAQAGDVISITSELYDWDPKYFRVMRVKEQETEEGGLVAQIEALEYNPDVYTIEPLTEFSTSANIGIGVYGASPNLPQPPVVVITEIDTDVAIPNFQMQIQIPTSGGPYDEIELFYTEGWDPMSMTGSIVPGTGTNGAPVGDGLLTVTAIDYGALNVGDYFTVGSTSFTVTEQLTNNPVSKTFASGGAQFTNTVTLNNVTGLKIGNKLMGTGLGTYGAHITAIAGSQVTLDTPFTVQAAGTYAVFGGLGTYIVDTSATVSGTTTLYDLPVDNDYVYLKKVTPEGNNPTFTNGETITTIITEVPANTQTYRRWFIKARMGIKKRYGKFSTPTITDRNGNFRYKPNPVASGGIGDLSDVTITNATLGDFLWYNGSEWVNENEPSVDNFEQTLRLSRTSDSAGEDYEDTVVLRLNDRVTDAVNDNTNEGGPAIRFERSSGTVYTKSWVSGGAIGATTVTLNNATNLVIGNKLTGTGLANGALITNIAGAVITLDTAFTEQAAGNYSTGTPDSFGQISMEYFGTTDLHRFRVVTSTDQFNPGTGTPPPYPNSDVLIESTKNYTDINDGVVYVNAVTGRVAINNSSPSYELHVFDTGDNSVQFGMTNSERTFLISNNAADNLLSFNFGGQNKLQFSDSTGYQWFNSGRLGVNNNSPDYTLDVTGDGFISTDLTVGNNIYMRGTNLVLNSDGTGSDNVTITFERGASDAVIKWNETTTDRFEFNRPLTTEYSYGIRVSQDLFGTGYHGVVVAGTSGDITTGGNFYFQRNGGTYPSSNAGIYVDRVGGATDSYISWSESDVEWTISNNLDVEDDLVVGNNLTVTNDIIQETGTVNKNTVTSTFYFEYSNSLYDPGVFQTIDSWDRTVYRSAKYILNIENSTDTTRYQMLECMILGTSTPYITVYGDIFNDGSTIVLGTELDGVDPDLVCLRAYALFPVGISGGITRITGHRILFAKST